MKQSGCVLGRVWRIRQTFCRAGRGFASPAISLAAGLAKPRPALQDFENLFTRQSKVRSQSRSCAIEARRAARANGAPSLRVGLRSHTKLLGSALAAVLIVGAINVWP